ncbi:hypothetical protein SDC49_01900 [Lactobacillus sp. R2/2]|nr:hypothetical protein [Lactobacillus sp. R2/2]
MPLTLNCKKDNATLNKEELLKEELTYSHYKADGKMWQKYIANAGKNVSWLEDHGAEIGMVANLGSGARTWHLFKGRGMMLFIMAWNRMLKEGHNHCHINESD